MNKLVVKLKQHTPLIHFQHSQEGATLRASEVKPKLDKFILTKLGNGNYEDGIERARDNGWLVGKGEHSALDYKMRIEVDETNTTRKEYLVASYISPINIEVLSNLNIEVLGNTPYFAQEKQNGQIVRNQLQFNQIDKKGLLMEQPITLEILLLKDNKLVDCVKKYIQDFFICTNFGTRQNKGFGSFEVIEIKYNDVVVDLEENLERILQDNFDFVYRKEIEGLERIFSTINNDYKRIKSGNNNPYSKSKLMLYAKTHDNQGWDKKYIKQNVNSVFQTPNNDDYRLQDHHRREHKKENNFKYYRALLGLAEQFEFLLENPPLDNKRNKMIIKIKSKTPEIQRFQSPLLYKVIRNTIYLVGNSINPKIFGKEFDFLVNIQNDNGYSNEPVDPNSNIFTPDNFDLKDFIKYALDDSTLGYISLKQ